MQNGRQDCCGGGSNVVTQQQTAIVCALIASLARPPQLQEGSIRAIHVHGCRSCKVTPPFDFNSRPSRDMPKSSYPEMSKWLHVHSKKVQAGSGQAEAKIEMGRER